MKAQAAVLDSDALPSGPTPSARRRAVEPAFADPRVDVRYEMKPSLGLTVGGAVLFGTAYAGAVVTGSIFLAPNNGSCVTFAGSPPCPGGNQQVAAGTLLIPVLGPFVAAIAYRDPTWSTAWSLVDGAAQVGGFAMMLYAARHPKKVPVYAERFQRAQP